MASYQARRNSEGDWEIYAVDQFGATSRTREKTFYNDGFDFLYVGWRARRYARQLSTPPKTKKVKAFTYKDGKRVKS